MFGPKVVVKYHVTQLESCLSISPIPLFALDLLGNGLRIDARGYSNWMLKYLLECTTAHLADAHFDVYFGML